MKAAISPHVVPRWLILAVAGCFALGWAMGARADSATPVAFPADRYAKMAAHSPFTPPTEAPKAAATPPPAPKTSFADKLNVIMLYEDHSVFYATVVDPDSAQHLYISSAEPDLVTQLKIESVQWPHGSQAQPGARETPVISLRKGAEVAQVRYEPLGTVGGGSPGAMPIAGGMGGMPKPFIPGSGGVRPAGAPPIPGNSTGGLSTAGLSSAPPQMPAPATSLPRRTPIRAAPQPVAPVPNVRGVLPGPTGVLPGRPAVTNADDDDDDD